MGLDTDERQDVVYFIGNEIENTAMKGEKTLFVVGVRDSKEIAQKADEHKIKHLYFGTSQSFTPRSDDDYESWTNMIIPLLKEGYWCTLDFGVEHAPKVLECGFDEYDNYISMISVKLPIH